MGIKSWLLAAGRLLQTKIKVVACGKIVTRGDNCLIVPAIINEGSDK